MTVIAVANQKGGSAKTTTTIQLGAGIALLGKKVLLLDMDPQGHVAEGFAIPASTLEREMSIVLDNNTPISQIIVAVRPNLDLAPSNIRLSYLEAFLFTRHRREDRLKNALRPIRNQYDFVLIDCPPSLGLLTVNALSAADRVLIPMACEFYSMLGVSLLLQTIAEMRAEINPELEIMGILPTRFTRTINAREVLERTKAELGATLHIYELAIPETVRFREATALGRTIYEHAPDSPGAEAYRKFAEEVLYGNG